MYCKAARLIKCTPLLGLVFLLFGCGQAVHKKALPGEVTDYPLVASLFQNATGSAQDAVVHNADLLWDRFGCVSDKKRPGRNTGQRADSPRVTWSSYPKDTKTIAIILDYTPPGSGIPTENCAVLGTSCVYWQVYNIDPSHGYLDVVRHSSDTDLKAYKPELSQMNAMFSGVVGPHWNKGIGDFVLSDGSALKDDSGGRYYLGICPTTHPDEDHFYTFHIFALNTSVSGFDYSYKDFKVAYGKQILDESAVIVRRRGDVLSIVFPSGTSNDPQPNYDRSISSNQVVTTKTHANLLCTENPFDKEDVNNNIRPRGVLPKMQWFGYPPAQDGSLALFIENETLLSAAAGKAPDYGSSKQPALSTSSVYTIDKNGLSGNADRSISCDFEACRHYALFGITPNLNNLQNNTIFRDGIAKNRIGPSKSFLTDPKEGDNLYTYAYRVFSTSATRVDNHRTVSVTGDSVGNGYFGPCAPYGTGVQKYLVTLYALEGAQDGFKNAIWDSFTSGTKFPQDSTFNGIFDGREAITRLSSRNFAYYFGSGASLQPPPSGSSRRYTVYRDNKGHYTSPVGSRRVDYNRPQNSLKNFRGNFDIDRTEFFYALMGVGRGDTISHSQSDLFTDIAPTDYIDRVAYFHFAVEDEEGCDVCRFCTIGVLPAEPGYDLWQQYGIDSPTGGFSPANYDPANQIP